MSCQSLLTVAVLFLAFPSPTHAISVGSGQELLFHFQIGGSTFPGPYDRVGFELVGGPDLHLSAFDAWDVFFLDGDELPAIQGQRYRADPSGSASTDIPLNIFMVEYEMGAGPTFEGPFGRLLFSNPAGNYGLGEVRIFLRNSSSNPDAKVYLEITNSMVIPEPRLSMLLLFGLLGIAGRKPPTQA